MDFGAMRGAFAARLGGERYRRFLAELDGCRARGRLRHWMQEVWDDFVRDHPEWGMAFPELLKAFRVCAVHGDELVPAAVRMVSPELQVPYTDEHHAVWGRTFPHAYADLPADVPFPTVIREMFVCPACQVARAEWERDHEPPELRPGPWPAGDGCGQLDFLR
jgi:hypothetical protein